MPITAQEVLSGDALRYVRIQLADIGTAAAAANQDCAVVGGLNGSGGTIVDVRARAGTAPVGTVTILTYDVNKNGTTVFTSTKLVFTTAVAKASQSSLTTAGAKVYNDDLITLDCDAIGNATPGANVGVVVLIRIDEPND